MNKIIEIDVENNFVVTQAGVINEVLKEEVEKLGSLQGGLMMIYGLYPGVPIENARAVAGAMERYAEFYT